MLIKTLAMISMPAGARLALSPAQLEARRHLVEVAADGTHAAYCPVFFKAGEVVDVLGDVHKSVPEGDYQILGAEKPKKTKKTKSAEVEAVTDTIEE